MKRETENSRAIAMLAILPLLQVVSCSQRQEVMEPRPMFVLNEKEELGRLLFFDRSLSTPPGQGCVSCHSPDTGFSNPDRELPVSQGAHPDRFGNRNDLTAAYASFVPPLHFDDEVGGYVGGLFWDGRADDLAEQAQGPPLNPLEMANPDVDRVVQTIRDSSYALTFLEVYGEEALDDPAQAYRYMAEAIAAWESSPEVNRFDSKYDSFLKGESALSEQELRGLALFEDPSKGNCSSCHPSQPASDGDPPLFTDHTYDNLGVPRNPENPFYFLHPDLNAEGLAFVDRGLGAVVDMAEENGKFRVPTLRNVDVSGPYMHNGIFKTLHQVVAFYNTRDIASWPPPEVPENVNREELGNLGLTEQEILDVVAFMRTLTDGYSAGKLD